MLCNGEIISMVSLEIKKEVLRWCLSLLGILLGKKLLEFLLDLISQVSLCKENKIDIYTSNINDNTIIINLSHLSEKIDKIIIIVMITINNLAK